MKIKQSEENFSCENLCNTVKNFFVNFKTFNFFYSSFSKIIYSKKIYNRLRESYVNATFMKIKKNVKMKTFEKKCYVQDEVTMHCFSTFIMTVKPEKIK